MKKYSLKIALYIMLFSFFLPMSAQEKNLIDGVVWVVGESAILRSDVETRRQEAQYYGERIDGDPYCVIPEQIAIQKLFLHQAEIDSITVNDGQIETQVNAQISMYIRQIGSQEKLEQYFRRPLSEIKDDLRTNMREQSLVQQVQQSLVENIKITPSDVRKFYNNSNQDSLPVVPAQVEVQIITIEPPIPAEVIEATKERLRGFADRINKGEADFSMLARLYSDDEESAKRGGELGFIGKGALVPEFANAAFALSEPGKISRVVETEFGFHIIQLIERRDDRINCRHILLRPRVTEDVKRMAFESLDSIANDIRLGKIPFEAAANIVSSDKDTKMNGGMMTNQNTASSKFEYQELPSEIAKVVYTMKPGEISNPFSMYSEKLGRDVYAIVKLSSKKDNHKANLDDDFLVLKSLCEANLKEKAIEDWIKKKITETYIYISPEWHNCDYHYSEWNKD